MRMSVNPKRAKKLVQAEERKGPVIYWMGRDQRVNDNWALLFASELAGKWDSAMAVAFCLMPEFLNATSRQYHFMLRGLEK
jgi:deoxyribodipyrimidine photo-lyase